MEKKVFDKARLQHPGLAQTSKMESFAMAVNNQNLFSL